MRSASSSWSICWSQKIVVMIIWKKKQKSDIQISLWKCMFGTNQDLTFFNGFIWWDVGWVSMYGCILPVYLSICMSFYMSTCVHKLCQLPMPADTHRRRHTDEHHSTPIPQTRDQWSTKDVLQGQTVESGSSFWAELRPWSLLVGNHCRLLVGNHCRRRYRYSQGRPKTHKSCRSLWLTQCPGSWSEIHYNSRCSLEEINYFDLYCREAASCGKNIWD